MLHKPHHRSPALVTTKETFKNKVIFLLQNCITYHKAHVIRSKRKLTFSATNKNVDKHQSCAKYNALPSFPYQNDVIVSASSIPLAGAHTEQSPSIVGCRGKNHVKARKIAFKQPFWTGSCTDICIYFIMEKAEVEEEICAIFLHKIAVILINCSSTQCRMPSYRMNMNMVGFDVRNVMRSSSSSSFALVVRWVTVEMHIGILVFWIIFSCLTCLYCITLALFFRFHHRGFLKGSFKEGSGTNENEHDKKNGRHTTKTSCWVRRKNPLKRIILSSSLRFSCFVLSFHFAFECCNWLPACSRRSSVIVCQHRAKHDLRWIYNCWEPNWRERRNKPHSQIKYFWHLCRTPSVKF